MQWRRPPRGRASDQAVSDRATRLDAADFFALEGDTYGQSFPVFLLQVTALSVAMAWLYWRTGGSLLLVMLMHAAVNNTKDIVPSAGPAASNPFSLSGSLVAWLTVGLLWVGAAYFLFRMRAMKAAMIRGAM